MCLAPITRFEEELIQHQHAKLVTLVIDSPDGGDEEAWKVAISAGLACSDVVDDGIIELGDSPDLRDPVEVDDGDERLFVLFIIAGDGSNAIARPGRKGIFIEVFAEQIKDFRRTLVKDVFLVVISGNARINFA